jgi:glycerol-3-phosphate acyltransferase PlsY
MIDTLSLTAYLTASLIGYGLGATPFGLVLTRIFGGIDIRTVGSGNIGATNVLRTGRKDLAFATLLLDGGKGGLAVVLVSTLMQPDMGAIAGLAAVIGHCFPIWLRFQGGKGVATAIATLYAIDIVTGLFMIGCWLVIALIFRISSLAAIVSFVAMATYGTLYADFSDLQMGVIWVISALSILRHNQNIKQLLKGEESRISFSKKP